MISKNDIVIRNERVKIQLYENDIAYNCIGENPICFHMLFVKNPEGTIHSEDYVYVDVVLYNYIMKLVVFDLYDTNGKDRLDVLERVNKLNVEKTINEKYMIGKEGFVQMRVTRDTHDESVIIDTILTYKALFTETTFFADNFS